MAGFTFSASVFESSNKTVPSTRAQEQRDTTLMTNWLGSFGELEAKIQSKMPYASKLDEAQGHHFEKASKFNGTEDARERLMPKNFYTVLYNRLAQRPG